MFEETLETPDNDATLLLPIHFTAALNPTVSIMKALLHVRPQTINRCAAIAAAKQNKTAAYRYHQYLDAVEIADVK